MEGIGFALSHTCNSIAGPEVGLIFWAVWTGLPEDGPGGLGSVDNSSWRRGQTLGSMDSSGWREAILAGVWLPRVGALMLISVESSQGGGAQGGAGEAGLQGTLLFPEPEGGVAGLHAAGGGSPGQLGCRMDRGTERGSFLTDCGSGSNKQGRLGVV